MIQTSLILQKDSRRASCPLLGRKAGPWNLEPPVFPPCMVSSHCGLLPAFHPSEESSPSGSGSSRVVDSFRSIWSRISPLAVSIMINWTDHPKSACPGLRATAGRVYRSNAENSSSTCSLGDSNRCYHLRTRGEALVLQPAASAAC